MKNRILILTGATILCFTLSYASALMIPEDSGASIPRSFFKYNFTLDDENSLMDVIRKEIAKAEVESNGDEDLASKSFVNGDLPASTKKIFDNEAITDVSLNLVDSDIEVIPSNSKEIEIQYLNESAFLKKRNKDSDKKNEDTRIKSGFRSEVIGKELKVDVDETPGSIFKFWEFHVESRKSRILVKLPMRVSTIKIKTTSGDLRLKNIQIKNLHVKTVSGDAKLEGIEVGTMLYHSVSGDLKMDAKIDQITGKTVSGDFSANVLVDSPKYEWYSTSGDIHFQLKKTANTKVNFSSVSGDLDFSRATGSSEKSSPGEFTIGQGQGNISLKTVSGDADIETN